MEGCCPHVYAPSGRAKSGHLFAMYCSAASRMTQATETFFSRAMRSSVSCTSEGKVTETRGAADLCPLPLFATIQGSLMHVAALYSTLLQIQAFNILKGISEGNRGGTIILQDSRLTLDKLLKTGRQFPK